MTKPVWLWIQSPLVLLRLAHAWVPLPLVPLGLPLVPLVYLPQTHAWAPLVLVLVQAQAQAQVQVQVPQA